MLIIKIWILVSLITMFFNIQVERHKGNKPDYYFYNEWVVIIIISIIFPFGWYYIWNEVLYEFLIKER